MNQEERKEAVLEWIQSGCNYDQGVQLRSQFGKNNFLRKDFIGKQHKYSTKIIYELCKSAGLNYHQLKSDKFIPKVGMKLPEQKTIQQPEPEIVPLNETREEKELPEIIEIKGIAEYPLYPSTRNC